MAKNIPVLLIFLALNAAAAPVSTAVPNVTRLELSTGTAANKEAFAYSKDRLIVKAGARVSLVFKNGASTPGSTYNFVLVKPGKAQSVIDASVSAGSEKGWVAETGEVLTASKPAGPGETLTIDFTAPGEPGEYPYVCTIPGHATMRGILKVLK